MLSIASWFWFRVFRTVVLFETVELVHVDCILLATGGCRSFTCATANEDRKCMDVCKPARDWHGHLNNWPQSDSYWLSDMSALRLQDHIII